MNAFTEYIKSTRIELRHTAWPTQFQTIVYTALVIGVSIVVALYIGFFDFFFTRGLEEFIRSSGGGAPITAPIETPVQNVDFDATQGVEAVPTLDINPTPSKTE